MNWLGDPAARPGPKPVRSALTRIRVPTQASSLDKLRPSTRSDNETGRAVQSQSVDVGSTSFSDYVRSAAFLDSAKYPSIDFNSTSVQRINDHTVRVSGQLTLLGVTKPLSVDVTVARENAAGRPRLALRAQTRIDRLEFGMNSGFPLVSRDVDLTISSEATES